MSPKFLQIHTLTPYPASLLNRDDAGFAKRIPFGGAVRTRISSQCLKRHWRTFTGEGGLGAINAPQSIRSRHTFEKLVVSPLIEQGLDETQVRKATTEVMKLMELGKPKSDEKAQTGQITVLGQPEIDHLRKLIERAVSADQDVAKAVQEEKNNLRAMKAGAGLGAAMFGRMTTSDLLARTDAAVHVAHAFTVHAHQGETDYFSAVDDLPSTEEEGAGAAHIGNTELTSGLYYGYLVVDLQLLLNNLSGGRSSPDTEDRALAAEALSSLLTTVTTVSPGAKLGSTAPYARAQFAMVEFGDTQPRTLANAFFQPVPPRGDLLTASYNRIIEALGELDAMYGREETRHVAGVHLPGNFVDRIGGFGPSSVPDLAKAIREQVLG